ncbi:23339_t:CDS:2, partial [Dentiscutata erythropus]
EEKSRSEMYDEALDDLSKKFYMLDPLFFGDMKFLICYAAAEWKVGFYAIDGTSEAASKPSPLFSQIPIGKPLRLQPNSVIIFDYTSVTKEVSIKSLPYADDINSRIKFLSSMYACARGCLSLVQAEENSPTICYVEGSKVYQLKMKTRGKRASPENENQLQIMTKHVLVGLECLHKGGFVHRDIKLSNILYVIFDNPANSSYVLIDFEHGGKSGEKMTELLKCWDDGTLDRKKYTKMSDIYQLGKLLEEFLIMIKSEEGRDFIVKLKRKEMDASEALKHPWLINL